METTENTRKEKRTGCVRSVSVSIWYIWVCYGQSSVCCLPTIQMYTLDSLEIKASIGTLLSQTKTFKYLLYKTITLASSRGSDVLYAMRLMIFGVSFAYGEIQTREKTHIKILLFLWMEARRWSAAPSTKTIEWWACTDPIINSTINGEKSNPPHNQNIYSLMCRLCVGFPCASIFFLLLLSYVIYLIHGGCGHQNGWQ